jgi:taurine transport system substrate-binding protein
MRKPTVGAALLALTLALPLAARAAQPKVVVAYQTNAIPYAVGIDTGGIAQATGRQVEFRRFNSGAEIFAALASGDVQIGDVGSSPFAASTSRGLEVRAVYVTSSSGRDEALVARNGSGVESLADLRGKRLAAAPVSTDHYQLLATLRQEGIPENAAQVLAIPQPEIVAGWKRGDIDAAFVWDPALGELAKSGKVLLTSRQVAERGAPTFGAFVADAKFADRDKAFLAAFVRAVDGYYRSYAKEPEAWGPDSKNAASLAHLLGGTPQQQADRLKDEVFIPIEVQATKAWLAGGDESGVAKVLRDTSAFLRDQHKITAVQPGYGRFVAAEYAEAALAPTN